MEGRCGWSERPTAIEETSDCLCATGQWGEKLSATQHPQANRDLAAGGAVVPL